MVPTGAMLPKGEERSGDFSRSRGNGSTGGWRGGEQGFLLTFVFRVCHIRLLNPLTNFSFSSLAIVDPKEVPAWRLISVWQSWFRIWRQF
jgi:hypothetical protein